MTIYLMIKYYGQRINTERLQSLLADLVLNHHLPQARHKVSHGTMD